MQKHNSHHEPVTLAGLNQKLDFEIKRLVREREEGVVKHSRTIANLTGVSTLLFKNQKGEDVTLSYRLDESGNLRFAREKKFANTPASTQKPTARSVGRTSGDIMG